MKKAIIKGTIVGIVFFLALFTISNIMNQGNSDMTVEMKKAQYPLVSILYGSRSINEMHGYAQPMEVNYMRESITPLSPGRRVSLEVNCYGRTITGLAFEVRSTDGQRLIESTEIEAITQDGDKIEASFGIKDLIESEKEYVLVLLLTMENGEQIRYYTRIVFSENYFADEKLNYAVDFSNKTFDKEAAKDLTKYLESNSDGDNTTLGKVTIHSSFHQVTWGDLQIERISEPKVTVKELASQTGSILLNYYVSVKEGTKINYYTVEEFFRVRYTSERIYLLDYERTMNQIFDETGDVFANNKIMLGITGEEVPLKESDGGNALAFITGNRLYSYNIADNKLAFLFGFYDKENQDDRTLYNKHDSKILNVDEAGNVTFMIYGYMNRGRHEGEAGISVYYYDSTVNTVEEMVYIPYYKSPDLLLAEVEQLAYINKTATIYLMLDNEIYGISAMNRSYEVIASELAEGSYQVSESNRMVVWQKEGDLYQSRELILMNLNTGEQAVIQAGNEEVIVPIGFMDEDLIYGIARESDIVLDHTGSTILPMYCVRIQNETEGVLKEYRENNVYITEGTVAANQISLKRVEKNELGEYEEISDHQIVNAEVAAATQNKIEVVAIDIYEKITQIALKNEIVKSTMKLLTPKEVLFEGGRSIAITESRSELDKYYVYGKNRIEGIFMDVGNAVNLAYEVSGVVINDAGNYVWMRGNRSLKNQIMAIQGEPVTEEKDSLAVCLDTMFAFEGMIRNSEYMLNRGDTVLEILEENLENAQVLDLKGCSLDAALYYVNQDIPVLVLLEDGSAVLLIGFNEMNTVLMNPQAAPETGYVYKMGMNDTREWFEKNGNNFITYIRND